LGWANGARGVATGGVGYAASEIGQAIMSNPLRSRLLSVFVSMMLLTGCAALEKQETRSTEQLLSAAGFDIKPADTPEKLANLQAMKQRKVVRRETKDALQFLYADAAVCRCVYVGDEQAYQAISKAGGTAADRDRRPGSGARCINGHALGLRLGRT
jgi:hypothetical protein